MPKVLLQSAAAPGSHEPRTQLIAALKGVLWREGLPVATFPVLKLGRKRYLEAVCAHLNAAEQARTPKAACLYLEPACAA